MNRFILSNTGQNHRLTVFLLLYTWELRASEARFKRLGMENGKVDIKLMNRSLIIVNTGPQH